MKKRDLITQVAVLAVCVALMASTGCAGTHTGKIPITTSSENAKELFLKGRDLSEKLRGQESITYFQQAVEEDPNFATAYIYLAGVEPTNKAFFDDLNKAVTLVDKISEGEKLWILGVEAGANGHPMKQRELYTKLVTAYPNDERAQTLLGTHYFGQQEYERAIEQYNKATKINPEYSAPYNQLGYAHRFLGNFDGAEKAFKKYIELIPDDPNPYDSYAELLMKMGRHEESIEYYEKALAINPNFVISRVGIATNYDLMGEYDKAKTTLDEMYGTCKNDGQRRATHFAMAVSYVHQGYHDKALKELDKQYTLAEKNNDILSMAGDLVAMGNIHLEAGRMDEATAMYNRALGMVDGSAYSDDIKANAKRIHLYNTGRVALKRGDIPNATTIADKFMMASETAQVPNHIRLAHELKGSIALEQKQYAVATQEFLKANTQNPYNIYRLAVAYDGAGDKTRAKEMCEKAANYNTVNDINHAFIRHRAKKMRAGM